VDEAMVRLNLAVAPNAWLMPARMVINTESTIGYNNKLKQAVSGMKLGVKSPWKQKRHWVVVKNSSQQSQTYRTNRRQRLPTKTTRYCSFQVWCWRRLRSVTLFLHKALKEEGGNSEDQQPGMFPKKADHLPGGAKNKRNDGAKEARQKVSQFFAKSFKIVSQAVGDLFQAV